MQTIKKDKIKYEPLYIRVEEKNYHDLHKLSYLTGDSISKMLRELIQNKLNDYRNVLTNSDIVIS